MIPLLLCWAMLNQDEVADPSVDTYPADLQVTLCQGVDAGGQPTGVTNSFFCDSPTLTLHYSSGSSIPEGHRIHLEIADGAGETIVQGPPTTTDGSWNAGWGRVPVAGQLWWLHLGPFSAKLYWDDEAEARWSGEFEVQPFQRLGLVIGIADYPPEGEGGQDLPGTDLSAKQFRDMLIDSFGFAPEHVLELYNGAATRAAIEAAITDLAERAEEHDAVVLYYIGHGTQIPDLSGDEEDGWDEALCPAEPIPDFVSQETQLSVFLPDDRLAELLAQFKTQNVTVIFESCHSGTALREGSDPTLRGLQVRYDTDVDFSDHLIQLAEEVVRDHLHEIHDLDLDERYVFVHASQSWETAQGDDDGGFLVRALSYLLPYSAGETWDAILPQVADLVNLMGSLQSPGVEGATRRFPFSLAQESEGGFYVRPNLRVVGALAQDADLGVDHPELLPDGVAGEHLAVVRAHSSVYVEQGGAALDVFGVDDPLLLADVRGRLVLTGQSVRVGGIPHAIARIEAGAVQTGDRLVPSTVRIPSEVPRVGLYLPDPPTPPEAMDRLLAALRGFVPSLRSMAGLRFLEDWELPEVDYLFEPREIHGQLATLVYAANGEYVTSFEGDDRETLEKAARFVRARHERSARILRMHNPSPAQPFQATLDGGESRVDAGGTVRLRIRSFLSSQITVILVAEGGEVASFLPCIGTAPEGEIVSFDIPIPVGLAGRVAMKVLGTSEDRAEALAGFSGVERGSVAEGVCTAMTNAFGSGPDALSTEGWWDATLPLLVR